jgi:hypothetical protein
MRPTLRKKDVNAKYKINKTKASKSALERKLFFLCQIFNFILFMVILSQVGHKKI